MSILPKDVKDSNKTDQLAEQIASAVTTEVVKTTTFETLLATGIVIALSAVMTLFISLGSSLGFIKEKSTITSIDFISLLDSLFGIGVPIGLGAIVLVMTLASILNLNDKLFSSVLNICKIVMGMCVAAIFGALCLAIITPFSSSVANTFYLDLFTITINYTIALFYAVLSTFFSIEMRKNEVKNTTIKKFIAWSSFLVSIVALFLCDDKNVVIFWMIVVGGLCLLIAIVHIAHIGHDLNYSPREGEHFSWNCTNVCTYIMKVMKSGFKENRRSRLDDSLTGCLGLIMATMMFAYLFYLVCTSPFDTQELICNSGWLFTETCDLLKAKS